jgi:hypothetical protein
MCLRLRQEVQELLLAIYGIGRDSADEPARPLGGLWGPGVDTARRHAARGPKVADSGSDETWALKVRCKAAGVGIWPASEQTVQKAK